MDVFTVAFFGHRRIIGFKKVEEILKKHIRKLLEGKQFVDFLVGRSGDYDYLASAAVLFEKESYGNDNSALVLVLPYMTAEYLQKKESFEDFYDEIEVCEASHRSYPKAAIGIRNRNMVDRADLVICYVERNEGGAYKAMSYAQRLGKNIINIADEV